MTNENRIWACILTSSYLYTSISLLFFINFPSIQPVSMNTYKRYVLCLEMPKKSKMALCSRKRLYIWQNLQLSGQECGYTILNILLEKCKLSSRSTSRIPYLSFRGSDRDSQKGCGLGCWADERECRRQGKSHAWPLDSASQWCL